MPWACHRRYLRSSLSWLLHPHSEYPPHPLWCKSYTIQGGCSDFLRQFPKMNLWLQQMLLVILRNYSTERACHMGIDRLELRLHQY